MNLLNEWWGQKYGRCERGLEYGDLLYLKPFRPKPILLGFYCGMQKGLRVVQLQNTVGRFEQYTPAFAATLAELKHSFY